MGADYVVLPHFLGGEHVADLLGESYLNPKHIHYTKMRHIRELAVRMEAGHEHPKHEGD